MKINSLKQKYDAYIPAMLIIALSLVIFLTAGLFSLLNWQSNVEKIAEASGKLSNLTAKKEALDKVSSQITALTSAKILVDGVLPTDPSIPIVMDQVQQIAAESGVTLGSLQFASKSESTSTISLQAAVSGPYGSVLTFLRNLENAGRLMAINSLRFTTSTMSGVDGVNMTLDISSPYFKLPVGGQLEVSKLTGTEFTSLINKIKGFRIYTPRSGDTSTGKANPFSQ